ncbi:hypothetical protein ACIBI3_22200 [Actinomadura luteofluorescens]|uniref:hypothetical protein n=1 Tax=Actinomadura luteofluorescens TaxID=46163 RepID=UPI00348FFAA7
MKGDFAGDSVQLAAPRFMPPGAVTLSFAGSGSDHGVIAMWTFGGWHLRPLDTAGITTLADEGYHGAELSVGRTPRQGHRPLQNYEVTRGRKGHCRQLR